MEIYVTILSVNLSVGEMSYTTGEFKTCQEIIKIICVYTCTI